MRKLVLLLLLVLSVHSQHNRLRLYYTNHPANTDGDHDCVYQYGSSSNGRARHLVPYCVRTREAKYREESKTCYGTSYTFDELVRQNVTTMQLVAWYASIDVITDYAHWTSLQTNQQTVYCNCSEFDYSFGARCQYQFAFEGDEFDSIVEQTFLLKRTVNRDLRTLTSVNLTCYTDFQCRTIVSGFCLDWRQICDGVSDCEDGQDEERCLEMELSECDPVAEYRCRNGQCIPRSFSFDLTLDCLDFYDEQEAFGEKMMCATSPSVDCEEHACGISRLSCGDGECFPGRHGETSPLCSGERARLFIKHIFSYDIDKELSIRKRCLSHVLSKLDLDSLFTPVDIDDEEESDGNDFIYYEEDFNSCTDHFIFPPNPLISPSVFLGHTIDSYGHLDLSFICVNQSANHNDYDDYDSKADTCKSLSDYEQQLLPMELEKLRDVILLIQSLRVLFSARSNVVAIPSLYHCANGMQLSVHRLFDGYYDCFTRNEDEDEGYASCYTNSTDRYACKTDVRLECIPRRRLRDGYSDCYDYEDEYFGIGCTDENDCTFFRQIKLNSTLPIVFDELCDGQLLFDPTWLDMYGEDESDETDCDDWPCNVHSIRCDGKWDRKNGCDEVDCSNPTTVSYIRNISQCDSTQHYCAKLNKTTMSCLPLSHAGDNFVDCLFHMDERKALGVSENHFLVPCLNVSSVYINEQDICNRHQLCPLGDDELLCPWHMNSSCKSEEFTCKNGTCITRRHRCNQHIDCEEGEDEWVCDLFIPQTLPEATTQKISMVSIPPIPTMKTNISATYAAFHCHRGVLLRGKDGYDMCACPPSYYGGQCQHQSHRLTISFRIETLPYSDPYVIFQLIFSLFDDKDSRVLTHELLVFSPSAESTYKHLIYLMYPSFLSLAANKSVRIDVYETTAFGISETSLLSWYYRIQFPFLPVNRLAVRLLIEEKSNNATICSHLACQHGTCKSFINSHRHLCQCDQEWTGISCNRSIAHLCRKLSCDVRSKCVSLAGDDYVVCLCSLGWTGNNCRVPIDGCKGIQCLNGGKCVSLDERTHRYHCQCPVHYFGDLCQFADAQLSVHMSLTIDYAALMIIHFLHAPPNVPGNLRHHSIQFHRNIHPDTNIVVHANNQRLLSTFIIAQLFRNPMESFYGSYHLLKHSFDGNHTNSIVSVSMNNRCPHVNEYINASLMRYEWLKRVKFYHKFLINLKCYYDEMYLCFIDDSDGAPLNCLIIDHGVANCTDRYYCENEGRCFQKQQFGQLDYACVCPECHYGAFCQLKMTQYWLTLDSMLGQAIITNATLSKQPLLIKILLTLVIILLITGTVSNMCSLVTFIHADVRNFGCGIYLLLLSIFSQSSLVVFLARFIYLLVNQMTIINNRDLLNINCLLSDFTLNLLISICDWLTSCVACERAVNTVMGVRFNKKLSVRVVKFVTVFLIVFLILTTIHQVFSRTLVSDPRSHERLWCVIKFEYVWLQTYNAIMNLFNSIAPFTVNLISTVVLLASFSRTKQRSGAINQRTYIEIWKSQLYEHKHLLISPALVIVLKLPVLIVLLYIKCIKHPWELHLALFCYLIALLPLTATFLIFVAPSETYRKIFEAKRRKFFRTR